MEESIRDFKWLFPEEKLRNTPSVRMNISPEKELTFRQKEAMLIQAIGSKAHLTQLAVKTSVVFMHRFFMYRSVTYYPRIHLAIAFALAGGKVEESESARKLEHLIRSAVEVLCANKNREFLDESDPFTHEMDCQWKSKITALKESKCSTDSKDYQDMRKLILECETEIYSVIGFQLQIVHPHNFVLRMCCLLGSDSIKDITQYAYNLATASSQLTMLCLKYKPETIATMCLNVAFKANSVQLTSLKDSKIKWYQVYDAETDFTEIEAVSEEFLRLLKGCPLLPTWMGMLARIGKRGQSGPVRGPSAYAHSRQQMSSSSSAAALKARSGISSGGQNTSSQSRYSSSLSASQQSAASDPSQHRDRLSQKDGRVPASSSGRPSQPPPSSSSARPQDNNSRHSSSSSSQSHPDAQSSAWAPPHPPPSSSTTSARMQQESSSRHNTMKKSGSSDDLGRSWDDHGRPNSLLKPDPGSEPAGQKSVPLSKQDSSRVKLLQPQHLTKSRGSDAGFSQTAALEDASPRDVKPFDAYSPIAVRPPSPPFPPPPSSPPPPADVDLDDDAAGSGNAQPLSSADVGDNSSSSLSQVPIPGSGPKLSLSDYRQRASAKLKEKASVPHRQSNEPTKEEISTESVSEEMSIPKEEETVVKQDPAPYSSSAEDKYVVNTLEYSFSKPQDSPSNPPIKLRVKRDPLSGEPLSVTKCADSGLKIKIKSHRSPKPEGGGDSDQRAPLEQSSGFSSTREEGEILDDSPSPASSTGSSRRSEGLRIRLSVAKSSDSGGGGGNQREGDRWSNKKTSSELESGHRSHHHHHHRSHHKSKKHKEHRSNRHEGKSSSSSHSLSKRSSSYSYDNRQVKWSRMSSDGNYASSSGGDKGRGDVGGATPSPPLPPLPPAPSRSLQHQNSGFSINEAFSTSLYPGHDDMIHEHADDQNSSAPTTPLDVVPPHHKHFHRMLEEHRARLEAKRPPLPPVPPPPPPPATPPPPPPPSH